ncbi:hypothetical protein ACLK2C_22305 [Escherichia coli]
MTPGTGGGIALSGAAVCHRSERSRAVLHQRIEQRFDKMLQGGFEQEVRALMARGNVAADLPSIRCVGYRQMWDYLCGEVGYDRDALSWHCCHTQLANDR